MKKAWVLSYPLSAQRRLWLDWADAQTDLSLRWAHSHFVGFVMRVQSTNYAWALAPPFSGESIHCLADHGQTIQSLAKCGSCHCIFRLLQTFLPLFSWKTIVNLNNQSGFQYLTEWLLISFFQWNRSGMKAPAAPELPSQNCRTRIFLHLGHTIRIFWF